MKHGKKYNESAKLVERATLYDPADALALAICHGHASDSLMIKTKF